MFKQILILLVGLQFGDEGKGKITDEFINLAQALNDGKRIINIRYQGGSNAGHTIYKTNIDGTKTKFVCHLAPTGIASNTDIAIGPNVAFDPIQFIHELENAKKVYNFSGKILISERVGILFDYHKKIDEWREINSHLPLGTTKSGIGPFYEDNSRRTTRITFSDYISPEFSRKLKLILKSKQKELIEMGISIDAYYDELMKIHESARKQLSPYKERLEYRLREYLQNGDHIIIEGAQGTMLDIDMGSLPYVTSSHLLAPHAFAGLGLPRGKFKIYGIEKIYPTRVGKGMLPTWNQGSFGITVAQKGKEIGAKTGRPRRVGYPDWVLIKRSTLLNDCDGIVLTRADTVQDTPIKVASGYIINDKLVNEIPLDLGQIKPFYLDTVFSWKLNNPNSYSQEGFGQFPLVLQEYIFAHDKYTQCPVIGISIGPNRGETIYKSFPI